MGIRVLRSQAVNSYGQSQREESPFIEHYLSNLSRHSLPDGEVARAFVDGVCQRSIAVDMERKALRSEKRIDRPNILQESRVVSHA